MHIFSIEKWKKPTSKNLTTRTSTRLPIRAVVPIDENTNESLEFSDSVHDKKRVGNLSEADGSAENLDKEDDEPEVDELNDEADEESTYCNHSVQLNSFKIQTSSLNLVLVCDT